MNLSILNVINFRIYKFIILNIQYCTLLDDLNLLHESVM